MELNVAAGADAEVLFVDAITVVSAALMEHMPCLRLIHSEGVAFDRIDLAARERGAFTSATTRAATPGPWRSASGQRHRRGLCRRCLPSCGAGDPPAGDGDAVPLCQDHGSAAGEGERVSWEELAVLTQRLFLGGMPAAALSAAPEGLTMELQQCTTTGAVVVLQNAAEETFSYGADYGLYRQVNGGWYQMNKEMDTIAMAYELAPGESRKLTLSWGRAGLGRRPARRDLLRGAGRAAGRTAGHRLRHLCHQINARRPPKTGGRLSIG